MGKYEKFGTYLAASGQEEVRLTFTEIEAILGFPLPASKTYQAWWSNSPANNVMTKAWREAGYRSGQVDIAGETVTFTRETIPAPLPPAASEAALAKLPRSPLFGLLKGTSIVMPGTDLTAPADPDWARVYDDDYVPPAAKAIVEDKSLSISDKIRELNDMGVARAEIARLLGKRYQHVRNVLTGDARKAG